MTAPNRIEKKSGLSPYVKSARSVSLFWRLFLSLLVVLVLTSILSIAIERWIVAREVERHTQSLVSELVMARQQIIQNLEQGNDDAIQQLYRNNRALMSQITVLDQQGQILYTHIDSRRRAQPHNRPHLRPDHKTRQLISIDSSEFPELQDTYVTSPNNTVYTIQVKPRLALHEIMRIRRDNDALRIGLIILFISIICYWFGRTLTHRIRRVQRAVHLMSQGQYTVDEKLARLGSDELGLLAKDVAYLSNRLRESEKARKQMLSDISHELRSPLARLEVATALTRDSMPLQFKAHRYLDRIEKESARMNELIEHIIHIQSLQMTQYDDLTAEHEPIHLPKLINDIAEDVCFEFKHKPINLIWNDPSHQDHYHNKSALSDTVRDNEGNWHVLGNYEQLHSALENIVRNAFIHSPKDATVEITLRHVTLERNLENNVKSNDIPALEIRIKDSGYGVAESDLQRIFQPFVRLSASRERTTLPKPRPEHSSSSLQSKKPQHKKNNSNGYGLGLAISEAVILSHRGQITAENRHDGHSGLVIAVVLPLYR